VAIGNAIFVRDRNSLTKNEQSMRSFALQTGPDETKLEGWPTIGLIESLKIQGDDQLSCFFRVGQLVIKLPLRKPARQ
jgi:hypothetical protein